MVSLQSICPVRHELNKILHIQRGAEMQDRLMKISSLRSITMMVGVQGIFFLSHLMAHREI
jgi:hypothetical protein